MDVNGLPMWHMSGRDAFGLAVNSSAPNIAHALDYENGHVRLARQQEAPTLNEDEIFARKIVSDASPIADGLGGFAWWNASESRLEASGFAPGSIELPIPDSQPPSPTAPSDFALGSDEVIYAARDGAVLLMDLRERWHPAEIRHENFEASLLAASPESGAWAFDTANRMLARVTGRPLRFEGLKDPDTGKFKPVEPNPNPPRLLPVRSATIPDNFDCVAIASSPEGQLALLAWETGEDAAIFSLEREGFILRFRLAGIQFPFGLSWIDEAGIAVMVSDNAGIAAQSFVFPMNIAPTPDRHILPGGRVHPLIGPWEGKFCNTVGATPSYIVHDAGNRDVPAAVRPLHPISGGRFARNGSVLIGPIDSGQNDAIWHRIFAEATLTGPSMIGVDAHASNSTAAPELPGHVDAPAWAPHIISATPAQIEGNPIPRANWCNEASELPFHSGSLSCPSKPDKSGLFNLLLQHTDRKVRRLKGRYLWLNVTLSGDSQHTPKLGSMRVYANRFSYRDKYLPGFYQEALGGPDVEQSGTATPHDFMDRLLCLFEGSLTQTEEKIAASWLLTDPSAAPEDALPWIGSWIGVSADEAESPARLRQSLRAAPDTARLHGTLGGLMAALELGTGGIMINGGRLDLDKQPPRSGELAIAKLDNVSLRGLMLSMREGGSCSMLAGGAVTRGNIVVLEGFRLRRTFATILGADLADEDDPITLGLATSGNSFVGDTLILGDRARTELLSLYRAEIDDSRRDTKAVEAFFRRLAHRVLVLVRDVSDRSEMERLRDIVQREIPAHVEAQVLAARNPLIVGASSLVGIDSFLAEAEPFERVRLGRSTVGAGDYVAGSGHLDRRVDGPVPPPPIARADGPNEVWSGSNFLLSALRSSAARGRAIDRHIWTWE